MEIYDYTTNDKGIIISPGRFEGEPLYVVAFYEYVLQGAEDSIVDAEDSESGCVENVFVLTSDDRKEYPALGSATKLYIWTDDQGFVYSRREFGAPYGEMCRAPDKCRDNGYCPFDPTCGD